jgi:anti-anti-sigma factor
VSVSEHQDELGVSVFNEGALSMEIGPDLERRDVRLLGELDIEVATIVETELLRLLGEPSDSVRVDLSELRYIDSIGLRCLVKAHRAAETSSTQLIFRRPSGDVARILALTKLDEVLPFDE